jgi:trans-aconitate methyltransferase
MPWDPEVYHKFKNERSAPFEDLLALVNKREGLKVIDLGCRRTARQRHAGHRQLAPNAGTGARAGKTGSALRAG